MKYVEFPHRLKGLNYVGFDGISSRITGWNWCRPDCLSAAIKYVPWVITVK